MLRFQWLELTTMWPVVSVSSLLIAQLQIIHGYFIGPVTVEQTNTGVDKLQEEHTQFVLFFFNRNFWVWKRSKCPQCYMLQQWLTLWLHSKWVPGVIPHERCDSFLCGVCMFYLHLQAIQLPPNDQKQVIFKNNDRVYLVLSVKSPKVRIYTKIAA